MAANKKHKSKKIRKNKGTQTLSWQREAILISIIALSILLFISNFGIGGILGNSVSSFFFGLFGIIAYVVPILIVLAALFIASNSKNKIAWVKVCFSVLLLILLCTFVELVVTGYDVITLKSGFAQGYMLHEGGGMLGTLLTILFVPNIGLAGGYIITIAGIIVSVIMITERSIFTNVIQNQKRFSQRPVKDKKVSQEQISERDIDNKREKSNQLRRERRVFGVAMNTKIEAPEDGSSSTDEMSEIHISKIQGDVSSNTTLASSERSMDEHFADSESEPEHIGTRRRKHVSTDTEVKEGIEQVQKQAEEQVHIHTSDYEFPPISLLKKGNAKQRGDSRDHLMQTADKLEQTLRNFGVKVSVTDVCCGPSVTRYELQPEQGVKVSKIVSLADDIKLNLAAADIRIEAPIPGKAAVGIEVPNKENVTVMLRELFEADAFRNMKSKITFAAGKDIAGKVIVSDIGKMPHVLIAGATGSGKSVCINTIIMSILYKARPDEVKLIMIDPKVVELSVYNGIPHLMIPVVTDPKKAAGALHWAVAEMTDRYQKFAEYNVRDLKGFNELVEKRELSNESDIPERMPQIVIIVDELADLMIVAPGDVEDAICRLAQLARAAGIHLIIATQRPSVNVITGLIKANMPSRVAFAVSSGVDSRTILDMNGAEKLLGKGDMLFYPQGFQKPLRVQGAFVSDKEVADVVDFLVKHHQQEIDPSIEEKVNSLSSTGNNNGTSINGGQNAMESDRDLYFEEAGKFLIDKEKGSIGMLQRVFKIGFNRAARIMDQLEDAGVVGPEEGTKPRRVLMTLPEFEQYIDEN